MMLSFGCQKKMRLKIRQQLRAWRREIKLVASSHSSFNFHTSFDSFSNIAMRFKTSIINISMLTSKR